MESMARPLDPKDWTDGHDGGGPLSMDRKLDEMIDKLVVDHQQDKAIEILLREYEIAKSSADTRTLDCILAHLVFAYSSIDPPDTAKARRYCIEREQNLKSAYNILQTGMFLYYTAHDYQGAVAKVREAIARGRQQEDNRTVYSSLSMLGLASLMLGRTTEATEVLREIEQMVLDKKQFVVGDETAFLESARNQGLEVECVRKIAATLAPLCPDAEFARRLSALAGSAG